MNAHPAEPPWYGPVCPVGGEGGIARCPPIPIAPQNIGNIKIKASGVFINTAGNASYGVHAYHKPETAGKVDLR